MCNLSVYLHVEKNIRQMSIQPLLTNYWFFTILSMIFSLISESISTVRAWYDSVTHGLSLNYLRKHVISGTNPEKEITRCHAAWVSPAIWQWRQFVGITYFNCLRLPIRGKNIHATYFDNVHNSPWVHYLRHFVCNVVPITPSAQKPHDTAIRCGCISKCK